MILVQNPRFDPELLIDSPYFEADLAERREPISNVGIILIPFIYSAVPWPKPKSRILNFPEHLVITLEQFGVLQNDDINLDPRIIPPLVVRHLELSCQIYNGIRSSRIIPPPCWPQIGNKGGGIIRGSRLIISKCSWYFETFFSVDSQF